MTKRPSQKIKQEKWDLSDLFTSPQDPRLLEALDRLRIATSTLETLVESISDDPANPEFLNALSAYRQIHIEARRLRLFAWMYSEAEQTVDADAFKTTINEMLDPAYFAQTRFESWWQSRDPAVVTRLLQETPERHFLQVTYDQRSHSLNLTLEQELVAKYNNVLHPLLREYQSLSRKFSSVGNQWDENYVARAAAYQLEGQICQELAPQASHLYDKILRFYSEHVVLPKYFPSWANYHNQCNRVPDAALDALLTTCRANTPLFHRLLKVLKHTIRKEQINLYDVTHPLISADQKFPYEEGVRLTLESAKRFDVSLESRVAEVFVRHHIFSKQPESGHSPQQCFSVLPSLLPWVQINYHNTWESVHGVAHEIGHAIHHLLASRQSVLEYEPCPPVGEISSVFLELLLAHAYWEDSTSDETFIRYKIFEIRSLLLQIMAGAYRTIFELNAYDMSRGEMREFDLSNMMFELSKELFGPAVLVPKFYRWHWVSYAPIFESPLRYYSYPFGALCAIWLYKLWESKREDGRRCAFTVLQAGGSVDPEQLLSQVGFDITDWECWQESFNWISTKLTEVESLI